MLIIIFGDMFTSIHCFGDLFSILDMKFFMICTIYKICDVNYTICPDLQIALNENFSIFS
jgi:hypothetical protein